jgi:hypothetical protein
VKKFFIWNTVINERFIRFFSYIALHVVLIEDSFMDEFINKDEIS